MKDAEFEQAREQNQFIQLVRPQIINKGQQAMSIFSGAVIYGGQFNISIDSLNQSQRPWPIQKLRQSPERGTRD